MKKTQRIINKGLIFPMGILCGAIVAFAPSPEAGKPFRGGCLLEGVVFGRKMDGTVVPLKGAEIVLRDLGGNSQNKVVIKTGESGRFLIKKLPLADYDVMVTPGDNPWSFRPIEGDRLALGCHGGSVGGVEQRISKVWYLNECKALKGVCLDSRSGKKIIDFEGSIEYSPLDLSQVVGWNSSFARVGFSRRFGCLAPLSNDEEGGFIVYLCKNSFGEGFKYFLTRIVFMAKGYKRKVFSVPSGNWGDHNKLVIRLERLEK